MVEVLTIGHSTLSLEEFVAHLRGAEVTAVADVRSAPYSRRFPHFNKDALKLSLKEDGISYVFLGKELGGRPKESYLFVDSVADYEKMAMEGDFLVGLNRVIEGSKKYRIALMCSEKSPFECHRCLLVGRALAQRGCSVGHILGNGNIMKHGAVEDRLLELINTDADDFFASKEQLVSAAYNRQARKVAFQKAEESYV